MSILALDIAYCIETEDFIDPDRAYDLFWADVIRDKRGFVCPGTNCLAQVTCANIDKDLGDMKVVPHFKIYGSHDQSCEIYNHVPLDLILNQREDKVEEKQAVEKSVVDIFELKRPASYYEDAKPTVEPDSIKRTKILQIKKRQVAILRESGSIGTVYSVRTLVGRYIRYRSDNSLEYRRVSINGNDVLYRSIFKCIWKQDFASLPDHPIIFYGWAYINRLSNLPAYQIKFKKPFIVDGNEIKPTLLINDSLIESYKIKKLVSTRLANIINSSMQVAFVSVYGLPSIKEGKLGRKYINFTMSNLDMIDISYNDPFTSEEQLKI